MSEYTYEIAALNINGISAPTRINMLEDFLHSNEIDLICHQEFTNSNINMIRNYSARISIGSENRVTAILIKDCYTLADIQYMPTGRGIATLFNGVKILHVNAPSGSEKKNMRVKPSTTWTYQTRI
jgi:exonuclease III